MGQTPDGFGVSPRRQGDMTRCSQTESETGELTESPLVVLAVVLFLACQRYSIWRTWIVSMTLS